MPLLFCVPLCRAQVADDFSDGDFSANPKWDGTTADFEVNVAKQLHVNTTAAGTSYLSTTHGFSNSDNKEWHYWVKQSFAPSTSNYSRIYLSTLSSDLSTNPDGFFLQLGESGSLDAVRLFKSAGGIQTLICSGAAGQIGNSFTISIKVARSSAGLWSLFTDPTGGTNYGLPDSGTDITPIAGLYTGILAVYTSTNAGKFYFDNIYAGDEIIDSQCPVSVASTPVSAHEIDLLFNEAVSGTAATNPANYVLNPLVSVQTAIIDGTNQALIHLTLSDNLSNGQNYTVSLTAVSDLSGNMAYGLTTNFLYLVNDPAQKGDVIFTEFMCDPSPVVGLAEVEFVEIYNTSSRYFDLSGWKLGDSSADGTIVSGWIRPGEYRILCAAASAPEYPGSLAVTSFPSLNNSGDDLVLKDPGHHIIDRLQYTDDWYRNEIKKDGGYSLELINPGDPCSDKTNWIASNHPSGGTPGFQNSVFDLTPDTQLPGIVSSLAIDSNSLLVTFSEGMDSTVLSNALLQTNPALTIHSMIIPSSFPTTITLDFTDNITASKLYQFTIGPVADCWLNTTSLTGHFALAATPSSHDLVINELFFDPGTGGSDFVELYNTSGKVLDLKGYAIANFDKDTIANIKPITEHYLLFPGEYVVLTADSNYQETQFPAAISGRFYQMTLPALNNDSSTVYLLKDSLIIDKVAYRADWHLALIDDTENKTLERIDPNGVSNSGGNWHTAAEPIGFGTPGGQNSQYRAGTINGMFGTVAPLFSPDNDGLEDVLQFYYTMPQPGMIATISVFDDQGRLIREVVKSELLGLEGNVNWDGINDRNSKATIGIYVAVIESFSIDGTVNFSKRTAFTLAGRLD